MNNKKFPQSVARGKSKFSLRVDTERSSVTFLVRGFSKISLADFQWTKINK